MPVLRVTMNGREGSDGGTLPVSFIRMYQKCQMNHCSARHLEIQSVPVLLAFLLSDQVVRPARMLAGMAISILAGRGTFLRFIMSTNTAWSIERLRRSLNRFSSPIVEEIRP